MCSGLVASQALKATQNSGRNRCSTRASFCGLFSVYAINHALNVEASKLRSEIAVRSPRVARLRRVEDSATSMRDAVAAESEAPIPSD